MDFQNEVKLALSQLEANDIREWAAVSAKRIPRLFWRRGKNLVVMLKRLANFAQSEGSQAIEAAKNQELGTHLTARGKTALRTCSRSPKQ